MVAGINSRSASVLQLLNSELVAKSLPAIDPAVSSLEDFMLVSGIKSASVATNLLAALGAQGVGRHSGRSVTFSSSDRMKAAMLCLKRGCDILGVSRNISWKDFEQLASELLRASGYRSRTNVRFVKPRMEIDVVGTSPSLAVAIDCKHWMHANRSSVAAYCMKQAARAQRLVESEIEIRRAIPVVLTLQSESVRFVEAIPVVPIAQFSDFLQGLHSHLPEIHVISSQL